MDKKLLFDDAVALLRELIATPSVSRDEGRAADILYDRMTEWGLNPQRVKNNVFALPDDIDPAKPTLLLNAHIDTVKPVSTWKHNPFCASREEVILPDGSREERIYGLGSNDDGASFVSLLHVFFLLIGEEASRNYNLVFVASAQEEVGGRDGIERVLPLLPRIDVGLVGEPTGMQPAIAEKGLVVIDGIAHGKSGHAARNEGVNALYLAVDAIQRLRTFRFERESTTLGPVKVTVTGVQAGTAHNVIPDTCTFVVDCRTTDAYSNDEVVELLRREVSPIQWPAASGQQPTTNSPVVELNPRSTRLQPSTIPADHPLLRRIVALGRQPFGSPTLSDQALMRFPTLKMGPGQSSRSHTADEYIRPCEIREAIGFYYEVLKGLSL